MKYRFFAIFATIMILSSTIVETVSAAEADFYDENFYSLNNIGWYDPRCTDQSSSKAVQLAGNDTTEKILNFFMRKGLSLAQASGIVGNMMQESGLNPAIIQGGRIADDSYVLQDGVGFGLVQWTSGGRQKNFMNHMREMGVGVTNLSGQLEFVWKEMSGSYPKTMTALKAADNPVDAAVAVHGPPSPGYEASADTPEFVKRVRGGNAQRVHDKYADREALAGDTADSAMLVSGEGTDKTTASGEKTAQKCDGKKGSGTSGDLATLTKSYAWADYKAGRTDQQPAYTEAVAKARRESRYVGGANGNDCGGFVTTLVHDSGHDRNYNDKGGNTITQIAWLKQNWQQISKTDAKDRKPGDVAINNDHTYIYVGEIAGFNSVIASASYSDRAPMAGREGVVDDSFTWYRKK
jgi:hypothetical protein